MRSRIPAIAKKETLHIVRDWRTLALAFLMPTIMILLFGWAITFDIRDIMFAVSDEDHSKASRELIERFSSSGYFKLVAARDSAEDLPLLLETGEAQVVMAVPHGYGKALARSEGVEVQFIFDGSENNTATIAAGYVDNIVAGLNFSLVKSSLTRFGVPVEGIPPIQPQVRVWFNPELNSTNTIVPGLVAVIMMVVSALLTSLTVVRERENGSLEGLIATPVRRHEVLIGKMLPYLALALTDCFLVTFIGVAVFKVPFAGSLALFVGTSLVFSLAGLSIGLLASVVANNQLFANQIVVLSTMLPSYMLSGFMFAIKSMPPWVQVFTYAVPARYFISIARGIMMKDQPAALMLKPTAFLIVFSALVMGLAVARFKKKI
jgi:ABC-2 type transport system permease protein